MLQKKICMLGSFSVGKTSLVRRFVSGIFSDKYQTSIGVKIDNKTVEISGEEVKLLLWDIYGEDRFQKVQMSYLNGMSGYLLVVDPTRRETLEDALDLQQRVKESKGEVPSVLVLNKSDLLKDWDIDSDRIALLERNGQIVLCTSAKTGEGVELAFSRLARAMLESPA
ncbi:MAG TPA: Rab family GTPase [Candidatus Acidoferrum sp.]|nr:Rab family GTPase [Candidatus Acidoferrum sp.]